MPLSLLLRHIPVILKSYGFEMKDVGIVFGFRIKRSKVCSWNRNYLAASFIEKIMIIFVVIIARTCGPVSPSSNSHFKVFQVHLLINMFTNAGMRVAFTDLLSFEIRYKYYRLF